MLYKDNTSRAIYLLSRSLDNSDRIVYTETMRPISVRHEINDRYGHSAFEVTFEGEKRPKVVVLTEYETEDLIRKLRKAIDGSYAFVAPTTKSE